MPIYNSYQTLTGLTLTNLTQGSVPFAGSGGVVSQDNTTFNYDSSNDIFSVSSSLGSDRVSNGSFTGSASGWTLGSGWAYSSNSVSHSTNGTATLNQTLSTGTNERLLISFTLSNFTAGSVSVNMGATTFASGLSQNGTYTYRVRATGNLNLSFTPSNTARFTVDNVSAIPLVGGTIETGDLLVQGSATGGVLTVSATGKSNGNPGTTRHALFENSGSNTWLDFRFSGTDRATIGANSSGDFYIYSSGGNYFSLINRTTNSGYHYNNPNGMQQYGYGYFQGRVHAGALSTPSSTLQSAGSTALKVKYVTANQTLDDTATKWVADASVAACSGVITTPCVSYGNQATCEANGGHGGCTWFSGYDCSAFNGDQSSCESYTGCTYESLSCNEFGDEMTCNSTSGCYWTSSSNDCSVFSGDPSACEAASGCSYDYGYDCSAFNGDQSTCEANGCSWDYNDNYTCSGTYGGGSCYGSYDTYFCDGSYYSGNCIGSYGAACQGSNSCSNIGNSVNCNAEPGCSWQTALTLTLPSIANATDRDYWIYNNSNTNADIIILPSSGDQVNHTTSYTLSNYKDRVHLSPLRVTQSCSTIMTEGACDAQAGCSSVFASCIWDWGNNECIGDPSCSGYGDQMSCEEAQYWSYCSGSYVTLSNWFVL